MDSTQPLRESATDVPGSTVGHCGSCAPRENCVETLFGSTRKNVTRLLQAISPKCSGNIRRDGRCPEGVTASPTCQLVCDTLDNLGMLQKLLRTRDNFCEALREIEENAGVGISESQPELKRFRIIDESLSLLRAHLEMDYSGIWLFKDGEKLAVHESGHLHPNADKRVIFEQIDVAVAETSRGGYAHLCPSNSADGGIDAVLIFRNLEDQPIGCLLLDDHENPKNIPTETINEISTIFYDRLHSIIREEETALVNKQLAEALRTIETYALELENTRHDRLTGLYRREFGMEQFEVALERTRRNNLTTSVVVLDIDKFKRINDEYGHMVGDKVLKMLGEILRIGYQSGSLSYVPRKTDVACRWGGEEFVLLLEGTGAEGARSLSEKISAVIRDNRMEGRDGEFFNVTVTMGISEIQGRDFERLGRGVNVSEMLFSQADTALYYGKLKTHGRNCIERYVPGLEKPVSLLQQAEKLREKANLFSEAASLEATAMLEASNLGK